MQAIILLGGFGTRLQSVVKDLPKPMALINGKPFLAYLLDHLHDNGIRDVVFSVHYLWEKIAEYFQDQYRSINITYAHEHEPLGTGGAILFATQYLQAQKPYFVLNGDTYLKLNYRAMHADFLQHQPKMLMALRQIDDCARYGKVVVQNEKVIRFQEKGECGPGLINGGVYLIAPDLFSQFQMPERFSIEKDFLFPHLHEINPRAFVTTDYFIDIGIPEDYQRAQHDLLTA